MFILKKIISELFYPVPGCLELLIAGLLLLLFTGRQRVGKTLVSMGVVLLAIFSYTNIPQMLLKPLERRYPSLYVSEASDGAAKDHIPSIKRIVVLGGGHQFDPNIPVTSQISSASLVRLIEGVRLYNKIPGSKLIVSGGKVFEPISEAEIMSEVAQGIGVNPENLILESEAKDTEEQARRIKAMVGNDGFILVTSAAHMPRSLALFKKLGMSPIPAPTGHRVKESHGIHLSSFFHGAQGLIEMECAIHEYIGYIWAKVRGQI